MRWYADNSDLNRDKGATVPDILLFGGIIVSEKSEHELRSAIEEQKALFGHARAPIKWNFKDLKKLYLDQGQEGLYQRLLGSVEEWRKAIFGVLAASDVTFVVAAIEAYGSNRSSIIGSKDRLTRYVFSNGLMRYGLHVKEVAPPYAQVIMDWPDKSNPKPFESEYAAAFNFGSTSCKSANYNCGALHKLGFTDSAAFTNMRHSTLLQAADLVVGATREFMGCSLGKQKPGQGVNCIRIARAKWRGAPSNILGRGLIISTGNGDLTAKVRDGLRTLVYSD